MKKRDFLLAAANAGLFGKRPWVITAFAVCRQDHTEVDKLDTFDIVQTGTTVMFKNKDGQLETLDGCKPGTPPFSYSEAMELKAGEIANLKKDVITTVGNYFFNVVCLAGVFGDKVEYVNKDVNISKLENLILDATVDDDYKDKVENSISVEEYLKFAKNTFFLTNYSHLCVWGITEKLLLPPPGLAAFKKQLLEENKDKLTDKTTLAGIEAKLVAFDAEYLKGDPGADNFAYSKKARNNVRKRRYLMIGIEDNLDETVKVRPVLNSLSEGWNLDLLPEMLNGSRSSTFSRSRETELGGEAVKWLLRASSNISISIDDCGATMGKELAITQANFKSLVGFSLLTTKGPMLVDNEEHAAKYLGSTVTTRSSLYCLAPGDSFCKTCIGTNLTQLSTGISVYISEYGSAMLGAFMSAMHNTAVILEKMDVDEAFS